MSDPENSQVCDCGGAVTRDGRYRDGSQRWRCRGKCQRYFKREYQEEHVVCGVCKRPFPGNAVKRYCSEICKAEARRKTQRKLREGDYGVRERLRRGRTEPAIRGTCARCGSLLGYTNKVGICRQNEECRVLWRKVHDKNYDQKRRHLKERRKPTAEQRGYPPHPSELPEDGIVDHIAVEVAVRGLRHVRLTPTEQDLATAAMVAEDLTWRDMCEHLGVGDRRMGQILSRMGYEVTVERVSNAISRRTFKRVA